MEKRNTFVWNELKKYKFHITVAIIGLALLPFLIIFSEFWEKHNLEPLALIFVQGICATALLLHIFFSARSGWKKHQEWLEKQ